MQRFEAGVEDAQGLDITDLMLSLDAAKGALANSMKGKKSWMKALSGFDQMHHVFPDAKNLANFFKMNKLNVNGMLAKINGYMHQCGVHTPGANGGEYNKIWNDFYEQNKKRNNDPYYIIGFGVGLFEEIAPILTF